MKKNYRFLLRLNNDLNDDLVKIADLKDISKNALINLILEDFVRKNNMTDIDDFIAALRNQKLSEDDIEEFLKGYLKKYSSVT